MRPSPQSCGVLLVDRGCRVLYANEALCHLLEVDLGSIRGTPCWQVMQLTTAEGKPFCRPGCSVWSDCRNDGFRAVRGLSRRAPGATARRMDITATVLQSTESKEYALLHMVEPSAERKPRAAPRRKRRARRNVRSSLTRLRSLDLGVLSRRETEVLELLASGQRTSEIGEELCISPITVRHHVQSILRKLQLHRRVDAILAWIRRRR